MWRARCRSCRRRRCRRPQAHARRSRTTVGRRPRTSSPNRPTPERRPTSPLVSCKVTTSGVGPVDRADRDGLRVVGHASERSDRGEGGRRARVVPQRLDRSRCRNARSSQHDRSPRSTATLLAPRLTTPALNVRVPLRVNTSTLLPTTPTMSGWPSPEMSWSAPATSLTASDVATFPDTTVVGEPVPLQYTLMPYVPPTTRSGWVSSSMSATATCFVPAINVTIAAF